MQLLFFSEKARFLTKNDKKPARIIPSGLFFCSRAVCPRFEQLRHCVPHTCTRWTSKSNPYLRTALFLYYASGAMRIETKLSDGTECRRWQTHWNCTCTRAGADLILIDYVPTVPCTFKKYLPVLHWCYAPTSIEMQLDQSYHVRLKSTSILHSGAQSVRV